MSYGKVLEASDWQVCGVDYVIEIWIIAVELAGSEKEVAIHRNLLASVSTYFDGLFTSSFAEIPERRITLAEDDANVFQALSDWLYTGKAGTRSSIYTERESVSPGHFWLRPYLMANYFNIIGLLAYTIGRTAACFEGQCAPSTEFVPELFDAGLPNKYLERLVVIDGAAAIEDEPDCEELVTTLKAHDLFGVDVAPFG